MYAYVKSVAYNANIRRHVNNRWQVIFRLASGLVISDVDKICINFVGTPVNLPSFLNK